MQKLFPCSDLARRPDDVNNSRSPATVSNCQAAYIHVPFCRHRCGYCNFTLVAGRDDLIETYLRAVELELAALAEPRPVRTLFFGGGTPSHLSVEQLKRLGEITARWFPTQPGAEVSLEANPEDLTLEKLDTLVEMGVTRLSLGAQSWNPEKLRTLDRTHNAEMLHRVCEAARSRFSSLALDLIFAVPGETRVMWRDDLQRTMDERPDHVSTYGLTIERGTRFGSLHDKQLLSRLAEDDEAWMYETTIDTLTQAGWEHYEVSNFARPGHRCRHNEGYWLGHEYYAAGPGAARYVDGRREMNHRSTTTYLQRVLAGKSPVAESEGIDAEERARERMVFGLRRLEGLIAHQFVSATGYTLEQLGGSALERFCDQGFLVWTDGRLHLSRRGLLVSDLLWAEFLVRSGS